MINIKKIINEWDPIELFPLASEDEYKHEIEKIQQYIIKQENATVNGLAKCIKEVFLEAFDEELFDKTDKDCQNIADKILLES